jgi:hypothetical protein
MTKELMVSLSRAGQNPIVLDYRPITIDEASGSNPAPERGLSRQSNSLRYSLGFILNSTLTVYMEETWA